MLFVSSVLSACQSPRVIPTPSKHCPFAHQYRSIDELGRATVDALNRGDTLALWNLSVTEREFKEIIWPRTPEHGGAEVDFMWGLNAADAPGAVYGVLDRQGRRNLRFERTWLADTTVVVYPEKKTYHNVMISAVDPHGDKRDFRFLNVVQEVDGWFIVVAFHD
jgi:hypothetical protein